MAVVSRSIRASGPHIKIRPSYMRPSRVEARRILMRNMRKEGHPWEPMSTSGFEVVCMGKLEAAECIWLVGGRHFPRPEHLIHNDDNDDFRYLSWLLRHHFRVEYIDLGDVGSFDERGIAPKAMQVRWPTAMKGWYPDAEDVLENTASTVIAPAVRRRFRHR